MICYSFLFCFILVFIILLAIFLMVIHLNYVNFLTNFSTICICFSTTKYIIIVPYKTIVLRCQIKLLISSNWFVSLFLNVFVLKLAFVVNKKISQKIFNIKLYFHLLFIHHLFTFTWSFHNIRTFILIEKINVYLVI